MGYVQRVRALLEEYEQAIRDADARRRPADGLLGFGQKPGDAPCHEEMDRKAAALAREMEQALEAGDRSAAAALLLRAEADRPWPEAARLALIAAQRYVLPLIPLMDPSDAAELRVWYERRFPVYRRLPVQRAVLRALKGK